MEQNTDQVIQTSGKLLVLGLVAAATAFAIDRITKWWLLEHLDMPSRGFISVAPFFDLVMVWNKGVSFGLFGGGGPGQRWVLTAISIVIVSVLFYWLQRTTDRISAIAFGLIIGGAVGNICDRFLYGAVADFFDFHIGTLHWPAFNIADSAITIGVVLIVLQVALDREGTKS